MSESKDERTWAEAVAAMVRLALSSGRLGAGLRSLARRLDPEAALDLLASMLRSDPQLAPALLQALPAAANTLIGLWCALGTRLAGLPAPQLAEQLQRVAAQLRLHGLGLASGRILGQLVQISRLSRGADGAPLGPFYAGLRQGLEEQGISPAELLAEVTSGWNRALVWATRGPGGAADG